RCDSQEGSVSNNMPNYLITNRDLHPNEFKWFHPLLAAGACQRRPLMDFLRVHQSWGISFS
ncbi:MAG: hypothetical protein JXR96_22805, partial [Deltaproteobacteria bacterium]|nr:hypothetical protein [Deltaproteobacteria bacterium]